MKMVFFLMVSNVFAVSFAVKPDLYEMSQLLIVARKKEYIVVALSTLKLSFLACNQAKLSLRKALIVELYLLMKSQEGLRNSESLAIL